MKRIDYLNMLPIEIKKEALELASIAFRSDEIDKLLDMKVSSLNQALSAMFVFSSSKRGSEWYGIIEQNQQKYDKKSTKFGFDYGSNPSESAKIEIYKEDYSETLHPVSHYIEMLPEPYKSQAKANISEKAMSSLVRRFPKEIPTILRNSFQFAMSNEGFRYWNDFCYNFDVSILKM